MKLTRSYLQELKDKCTIFSEVVVGKNVTFFPYAVIGRPSFVPSGATSRRVSTDIEPTIIGDNSVIGSGVVIYHGSIIGKNCLIGDQAKLMNNVVIGDYSLVAINVKVGYETIIGHHTRIMDLTNVAGRAVVGNNVFIGPGVMMGNDNKMGRAGGEGDKGPIIEDYVTIGMNASILPGVRIGKDSIIAAGSVVTRDVEPGCLYMGTPAKFKRKLRGGEIRC